MSVGYVITILGARVRISHWFSEHPSPCSALCGSSKLSLFLQDVQDLLLTPLLNAFGLKDHGGAHANSDLASIREWGS